MACIERDRPPCHIHSYTVYTPIGGKGRCHTRCDLQDHSTQARKSAGEISTLDLKPMRKDIRGPKQEQSVAPQNRPWSRQKNFKKKKFIQVNKDLCDRRVGVAEWLRALCCGMLSRGFESDQCLWTHDLQQVDELKRCNRHAGHQEVSRCCTRGESEDHRGKHTSEGSTLALKPRADVTRSPKPGYQWPHKKDLCLSKYLKNKNSTCAMTYFDFIIFYGQELKKVYSWIKVKRKLIVLLNLPTITELEQFQECHGSFLFLTLCTVNNIPRYPHSSGQYG